MQARIDIFLQHGTLLHTVYHRLHSCSLECSKMCFCECSHPDYNIYYIQFSTPPPPKLSLRDSSTVVGAFERRIIVVICVIYRERGRGEDALNIHLWVGYCNSEVKYPVPIRGKEESHRNLCIPNGTLLSK